MVRSTYVYKLKHCCKSTMCTCILTAVLLYSGVLVVSKFGKILILIAWWNSIWWTFHWSCTQWMKMVSLILKNGEKSSNSPNKTPPKLYLSLLFVKHVAFLMCPRHHNSNDTTNAIYCKVSKAWLRHNAIHIHLFNTGD